MGRADALEMAAGCTILLVVWSRSPSARCVFETRLGISLTQCRPLAQSDASRQRSTWSLSAISLIAARRFQFDPRADDIYRRAACAPPTLGAALLGTARSWRGIVPFTHLAREGRMTVTIGRRGLLAALGGAAAGADGPVRD